MSWDVTGEPILHVDATPDEDYPLRILRAHRANCEMRWATSFDPDSPPNELCNALNAAQEQRAEILDRAITALEADRAFQRIVPPIGRVTYEK